jgi:hypothetical protein
MVLILNAMTPPAETQRESADTFSGMTRQREDE